MAEGIVARRIAVDGTVQGVGFRPFVWRLASQLSLAGSVRNVAGRVEIEASGPPDKLDALAHLLAAEAPPRARVSRVTVTDVPMPATPPAGFTVADSTAGCGPDRLFPPDLATCDACVAELFDPADRRFRYPFINCTDCGPRATIIDSLPYDRHRTTMADFPLCPACRVEYLDPANRRFHAEPVACPVCGPRLAWRPSSTALLGDGTPDRAGSHPHERAGSHPHERAGSHPHERAGSHPYERAGSHPYDQPPGRGEDVDAAGRGGRPAHGGRGGAEGTPTGEAALRAAVEVIAGGGIVAVKGLGGYHLACDATDERAVRALRERKHRWAKPLAVMVADLPAAHRLAELDGTAETELVGPARPIVLARYAPSGPLLLAPSVLAGLTTVGVFLPYTGLHHLLLAALARPIVLTSGNRSDEPIAVDDDEAVARLGDIADGFLSHDRRIRSRYEDSVLTVVRGGPVLLRRGRGYAPEPVDLPVPAPEPVLAVGAQLKHTFAVARDGRAHLGAHTGDLADLATLEAYRRNLAHLCELLEVRPAWVAHDLHPAYLSTQEAAGQVPADRLIPVQHHHAHVAACLAEHGLTGPVVGVALDGLGMGDDGTFWGGEVLVADVRGYRRVGRFGRAPMPGGEAAVRQPWRMALGYLFGAEDPAGSNGPVPGETARGSAGPAASLPGSTAIGDTGTAGRLPDSMGTAAHLPGNPGPIAHLPGSLGLAGGTGRGLSGDGADPFDPGTVRRYLDRFDPAAVSVIRRQIERGLNSPVASSAGRLFDAASSILGLCDAVRYEGEAAIILQHAADPAATGELPYRLVTVDTTSVYDPRPTLAALLAGVASGVPAPVLAARFQRTIAAAVTALAIRAARDAGLDVVCLSGGVFCNEWLLTEVPRRLADAGLTVLHPRLVPPGDGGISLGQAAVAAARLASPAPPTVHPGGTPCA